MGAPARFGTSDSRDFPSATVPRVQREGARLDVLDPRAVPASRAPGQCCIKSPHYPPCGELEQVLAMLNDGNDEDSLGHVFRILYSRVCRAVQMGMKRSHTTGTNIDELRLRLAAWDDIVGVNKDTLDLLDDEDPAGASRIREFFAVLSYGFEHIEYMIGLRTTLPSDGIPPRQDSISYVNNLLLTRLPELTGLVTSFIQARQRRRPEASHSASANTVYGTAAPGLPSNVSEVNHYVTDVPLRRSEHISSINGTTPYESMNQDEQQYYLSRPSSSGSGVMAAPASNSPWPSISQLLSHQDRSYQTPSTISTTSSPLTPFTTFGQGVKPTVMSTATHSGDGGFERLGNNSSMTLSPVLASESFSAGPYQTTMEPRTESTMESHFRGGSAHLEFFSTDSRNKSNPETPTDTTS